MAYKQYNFNEEDCKIYKGIKYYKFEQEYIILIDNMKVKRFSIKDVKKYINDIIED